jgi:hypothetical protein
MSHILPQLFSAALQQCAMVSKEKMAFALDFDPGNSSYWSGRHRDIVFGANYNAFATKFTRGLQGGYKDGLQPESLADGNWLVKQNQPVSKIETKSDTNLRSLHES